MGYKLQKHIYYLNLSERETLMWILDNTSVKIKCNILRIKQAIRKINLSLSFTVAIFKGDVLTSRGDNSEK